MSFLDYDMFDTAEKIRSRLKTDEWLLEFLEHLLLFEDLENPPVWMRDAGFRLLERRRALMERLARIEMGVEEGFTLG